MPIRPNFSFGQVLDPTRNLQRTFSSVSDMLVADTAQKQKAERLQLMQANAERSHALRVQEAERAQKQDTATAKYRGDVLTGQELSRKRAQENIQYNRNIASGEVEGAMLPLNEISTTPGTKDVLDTNLANKKLKEMSDAGTFDSAPTEEAAQKAYHEYLAKNDPNYYKSQPRKIGEAMVQNTGRMVPYVGQAVQGVRDFVMGDSSTHGQYQKGLNAPKIGRAHV